MFCLFNIWLGSKFPDYFNFFAKTCEYNKNWHWFLFTDQTKIKKKYNKNITLIPYNWDLLYEDCPFYLEKNNLVNTHWQELKKSNLTIWPKKGWPARLFLAKKYFHLCEKFDFIGTFDCDILYGNLDAFMPKNIKEYGMITGHSGILSPNKESRVCFPFMIFKKEAFNYIFEYVENRENIVDANYEFSRFFKKKYKVFSGNCIQPIGEKVSHFKPRIVSWNNGKLHVNNIEGGFYHLIFEKNFKWDEKNLNKPLILKSNKGIYYKEFLR